MRRGFPLIALTLLAVTLAGCGDPALWARWRAERALWLARRAVRRIDVRPQLATDADFRRAAVRYDRLIADYPAAVWMGERPPGSPVLARDVAVIAGRAAIERARLDEKRGRTAEALAGYARARGEFDALPDIAVDAGAAQATALERAGRGAEAVPVWEHLARAYGPLDPATGAAYGPVLDGTLRIAAYHAAGGRAAASESTLAAGEARLAGAMAARPRVPEGAWLALSDVRAARNDLDGCLDAVRQALARGEVAADRRGELVLLLAQRSLEGRRPDSARAYAHWAATEFWFTDGLAAMTDVARAWEMSGPPDSALGAWSRLLETYPKEQDATAEARFRRAVILEGMDRWDNARTEFRALAAAQPSHPLAFEAQLRIVQHLARNGEPEAAHSEGLAAVDNMERLIETQHDLGIQRAARHTRAELFVALEDWPKACDALAEQWHNDPGADSSAAAGLQAAGIAETHLGDRARAAALYRELAGGAADPDIRDAAADRLRHLQR
jgi:hypothetical protein